MICCSTLLWIILIEVPLDDKTSKVVRLLNYKTTHMQYKAIFKVVKMKMFSYKMFLFLLICLVLFIFAQNIDCGSLCVHRSNEYPQSMF